MKAVSHCRKQKQKPNLSLYAVLRRSV